VFAGTNVAVVAAILKGGLRIMPHSVRKRFSPAWIRLSFFSFLFSLFLFLFWCVFFVLFCYLWFGAVGGC
jgi:hypothetical protein